MSDRSVFENPFPSATEADWRARVDTVLKGGDFEKKLVARTRDGIAIQPLYQSKPNAELVKSVTSGSRWRVSARVDHPETDEAAKQAREDLEGGSDMLALAFGGSRAARGFGIAPETLGELDQALAGVHLDLIRLRLDPSPAGRIHALMVAALIERRKLNPAQTEIDFGLDPLSTLTALGHVPWDWADMGDRLHETVASLKARGFGGPFLTVDLRPYHEAGASEGQELAIALSQGVLYLRALEARGLPLAEAFKALSFIMPVDGDQFMGIAKLRAFRKLWDKIALWSGVMPTPVTIHAETSWRMLTRRDPHVNILRNTMAVFAAGIGGADTVTVLPFTQALGLPDAQTRRLARNTSIVLMEEANLWRVTDPVAGAGGYEALTDELAQKAWALFQDIENEGGLLVSLVMGHVQRRLADAAKARAKDIATRKEPLTGTSEFAQLAATIPAVLPIKPPKPKVPKARAKAKHGSETIAIMDALLAGASRSDVAPVFTSEMHAISLPSHRLAEPFEALRDRSDAILKKRRRRPHVTLVTMGPLAEHGARLAFMRNFFEAGGIATEVAAMPEDGNLLCIVGSDAAYAAEGAKLARKLKAKDRQIWMAGRPGELEETLKRAGVRRFVFMGSDVVEALSAALEFQP